MLRCILAFSALLVASTPAHAQGFLPFSGNWSGFVKMKNETLKCNAYASVPTGGARMKITVRCAGSAGVAVRITASITHRDGIIAGTWEETNYNVSGSVSGSVSGTASAGAEIKARIVNPNYKARLTIRRHNTGLSIDVVPEGNAHDPLPVRFARKG